METATKIINKSRGGHNVLTHRKFKTLLEELNSDHGDLLVKIIKSPITRE